MRVSTQGVLPECAKYYKEERNKQADLLLHPVAAMVRRMTGVPNSPDSLLLPRLGLHHGLQALLLRRGGLFPRRGHGAQHHQRWVSAQMLRISSFTPLILTFVGFITKQWVDGVWQAALMAIDRVMEQQLVRGFVEWG